VPFVNLMQKLNYQKLILLQSIQIVHCIEEYFFGFSNWATNHFGTTTQNWYILSHIFIFIIFGIMSFYVYKAYEASVFFVLIAQVILFTNGLFHIVTTIIWREYSPGIISQIIVIPISCIIFRMIRNSNILNFKKFLVSIIIGCIISILIIASLYLNISL